MLNRLTVVLLLVSGVISASNNINRIGGGIASERSSRPFQVSSTIIKIITISYFIFSYIIKSDYRRV